MLLQQCCYCYIRLPVGLEGEREEISLKSEQWLGFLACLVWSLFPTPRHERPLFQTGPEPPIPTLFLWFCTCNFAFSKRAGAMSWLNTSVFPSFPGAAPSMTGWISSLFWARASLAAGSRSPVLRNDRACKIGGVLCTL